MTARGMCSTLLPALALALAAGTAHVACAAEQTILGDTLRVKNPSTLDKRKVVGKAKEKASPNTIVGNPTAGGATLTIRADGGTLSCQTFTLPQGTSASTGKRFWSGDTTKGFKYKDSKGDNGPIKTAQIKKSGSGVFRIKAIGSGKYASVTVLPPDLGTSGCIRLQIADGDSYSARFGPGDGDITNKGALEYKHKKPTGEGTCGPYFQDWGDGTIRDICTGLQWEKKTTAVGSGVDTGNPHDVDNTYSWAGCCDGDCSTTANYCQPDAAAAATCTAQASGGTEGCSVCGSGTCNVDPYGSGTSTTVWDWLNQVNAENFAGHNDWRLPSEQGWNTVSAGTLELESILLAPYVCGTSPCINSIFGPTVAYYYWSATTDATFPVNAWYVLFGSGHVKADVRNYGLYVRAVRDGL